MTRARPGVRKREGGNRDELPRVAVVAEGELQHARRAAVVHLAVGLRDAVEAVDPDPTGANRELPDAQLRIRCAVRLLRREPLVHFVVRVEHDLRPGGVQIVPQRLHRGIDRRESVARGRAEAWDVPHGERALGGVGGQVRLEPQFLRRAGRRGDVAVQHDDVPGAQVVAVVELSRVARRRPEILPIARRTRTEPLHVPGRRPRARLVPAPRGVITVDKIWGAAARAQYVIAEREHGAGDRVENRGRGFVIGAVAPRDVPGAHQDLARYHHGGADARRTRAGGARASGADRLVL